MSHTKCLLFLKLIIFTSVNTFLWSSPQARFHFWNFPWPKYFLSYQFRIVSSFQEKFFPNHYSVSKELVSEQTRFNLKADYMVYPVYNGKGDTSGCSRFNIKSVSITPSIGDTVTSKKLIAFFDDSAVICMVVGCAMKM